MLLWLLYHKGLTLSTPLFTFFEKIFCGRLYPLKIKAFRLSRSAVVLVLFVGCGAGSGRGADAVPPCHAVPRVVLLRALCGAFLAVGGL